MTEAAVPSSQVSACPLARQNRELFNELVSAYCAIVQLAVQRSISATELPPSGKLRGLARRAGQHEAIPQDMIAIHLSALAILVREKPHSLVKACVRHSRLLLVKMMGELALYYRERANVGN